MRNNILKVIKDIFIKDKNTKDKSKKNLNKIIKLER